MALIAEGSGIKCMLLHRNIRKRNLEVMRTKVILVEATGCDGGGGGGGVQETYEIMQ